MRDYSKITKEVIDEYLEDATASYKTDLMFYYNMTEEEANNYYKQIKFNQSIIENKINNAGASRKDLK